MQRHSSQVDWYESHANRDQTRFRGFQILTLFFSGLTPVLIAFDGVASGIEAASSGIAAICAGAVAVFNWRGNWVRFARTAEQLKSEMVFYNTRTSAAYSLDLSEEQALENFVIRIEAAALTETGEWGAELTQVFSPRA